MSATHASVDDELRALAAFYCVQDQLAENVELSRLAATYCEVALTAGIFEVIVGGAHEERALAALATKRGLSPRAAEIFLKLAKAHPGVMLGAKFAFGRGLLPEPTLYVRTKAPRDQVLDVVLAACPEIARFEQEVRAQLADVNCLYGIGMSALGEHVLLKTYTLHENVLGRVGFRSLRVTPEGILPESREYVPGASLADVPAQAFLRNIVREVFGVDRVSHWAFSPSREPKLYVERVGAIATDLSCQ